MDTTIDEGSLYRNDNQPGGDQLKVWGDVTERVECLVEGLIPYGWHPEQCGWPQPDYGQAPEHSCAQLIALDGEACEQLPRLQPLLTRSDAESVFVCAPQAVEHEKVRSTLACSAYAYQCLPGDTVGLDAMLRHARSMATLRSAIACGAPGAPSSDRAEYEMVGTGLAMQNLFEKIRKVASVEAPVLIRGESGSGKELAAESIHERSSRAEGPFIAVNCAALPAELVQSELFGHEKGAFTGATRQRIGTVEAAAGGTLLLDEIGDLPLSLQVHLLRFLQSGRIQRVGGNEEIPVDVRVLAATHVPLEQAVAEGRFREDLYHRLNVISLHIPPLRERPEDIEVLARFFFERFAAERPARMRDISRDALQGMCRYSWPGNVREFINRLRRGMVMSEGRLLSAADLNLDPGRTAPDTLTLESARNRAEREQVEAALVRNRHCITSAARELAVSRVTLYRLVEKYQLDPRRARKEAAKA